MSPGEAPGTGLIFTPWERGSPNFGGKGAQDANDLDEVEHAFFWLGESAAPIDELAQRKMPKYSPRRGEWSRPAASPPLAP